MTDYEVIEKIMNSKLSETDKIYVIKTFLLHWSTVNDIKWIWE